MAWPELRWDALSAALVLFMQAGFTILHAGLIRPKNGVNVAVMRVAGTIIAALGFWVCGFGLELGSDGGGLVGTSGFFVLDGRSGLGPSGLATFCLHLGFAAAVAAIVSGAIAERMPFRAHLAITAALATFIYPIFGHWTFGGGWLSRLSFIDFAGATTVHSLAGWAALAMVMLVGNRTGSYTRRGLPVRIPGASIPLATIGLFILWLGWLGWNSGLPAEVATSILVMNTVLAGAAGGLTALGVSWISDGVSDATPAIQGVLAGLVAVSACANAVMPPAALAIGAGGGATMLMATRLLERYRIDDAVGAIPVHLGGGLWGTLAVAIFAPVLPAGPGDARGLLDQLGVQLLGAAACAAWGFGATTLAGRLLRAITPLRVSGEKERVGLNVSEHQAGTELMEPGVAVEASRSAAGQALADPFVETALLAVSDGGAILAANPTTSAIFGYGEWELRSLSLRQLFAAGAPEHDALLAAPALRAAIGGPARELRGARRTGEELPVEVVVSAPEAAGTPASFTVAIRDISARREKEEGRTRAQVEIRQRFARELEAARLRDGASFPADHDVPRGQIATLLPAGDWFGYVHDARAGALVFYAGELTGEAAGTAALLSGFASGGGRESDYRHGLLLGDARYTPARQLQNLAEVLNRIVVEAGKGELRMPIVLGHLDLPTGTLTWIDAGGASPIWVRLGQTVRHLGGDGEPIGASPDPHWQARGLDLASGDLVVICPPGLIGSFGPDGRALTARELKKIILDQPEPAGVRDQIVTRAGAVWRDRAPGLAGVVAVRIAR